MLVEQCLFQHPRLLYLERIWEKWAKHLWMRSIKVKSERQKSQKPFSSSYPIHCWSGLVISRIDQLQGDSRSSNSNQKCIGDKNTELRRFITQTCAWWADVLYWSQAEQGSPRACSSSSSNWNWSWKEYLLLPTFWQRFGSKVQEF